jgi:DNA-3-methyladenine glycosylase I
MPDKKRCAWAGSDPLMMRYHDAEWGVPLHEDQRLFEFLILEGAQAGLSWRTVLYKREAYREAFHGFDPRRVAAYTARDTKRLMANAGIIRNRLKIASTIQNARGVLTIQKEFGSLNRYLWQFVGGKPLIHRVTSMKNLPAKTKESDAISKDLLGRGFKFVGSTICYSLMQAVGMVNDHVADCFRYSKLT